MTLISAIITDAYRESNLVMLGQQPSALQQTEALARLSSMIAGVYGYDAGEELNDWMVGALNQQPADRDGSWQQMDWSYPIENSRILLNHEGPQTLHLPRRPQDGARIQVVDINGALATYNVTLNGNGRLIEAAPTVLLNTASLNKVWIYNENSADWRAASNLGLADEMPFPEEFDDYFLIRLAGRINPRYGRSLNDLSLMRLAEVTEQLEARYRQTRAMPVAAALRSLSGPSNGGYATSGRRGRFGWQA